jgi:hypothetical protein
LIIKEVMLDQKRRRGYVWIRIVWQTGSTSEHWYQRTMQGYAQHADQDRLRRREATGRGEVLIVSMRSGAGAQYYRAERPAEDG